MDMVAWSSRSHRSAGAFALAALVLIVSLGTWLKANQERSTPATSTDAAVQETPPSGDLLTPIAAPWLGTGVPKVDYVIDLSDGTMTTLPEAIIRSVAKPADGDEEPLRSRYAASPDGLLLAFLGPGDKGSFQIFVAGIDGTGIHQVTHDPTGVAWPAWSPDGTRIAYQRDGTADDRNIFVLDLATGDSTRVTDRNTVRPWAQPQFTPDGSSVLYTGGTDQQPLLMTVPVAGGRSTLLVGPGEGLTDAGNGSMSPDGSLVTFLGAGFPASGEVEHCGPCRFMANADGTERRVIPGWMSIPAGTWSPDGSRIVVSDGTTAPTIIVVVDVATRVGTTVANGRAAIWVDDHSLLVEV